jgi:uncharacterized protein (TIGR03437 family)
MFTHSVKHAFQGIDEHSPARAPLICSFFPFVNEGEEIFVRKTNLSLIVIASALLCPGAFAQNSSAFTTVSAGNWGPIVAPDSIAAGFGSNLTTQTFSSLQVPLPLVLANVAVQITDSSKTTQSAGLFMASQGQVNYEIPSNTTLGLGTATVTSSTNTTTAGNILISNVAPAIFAANENGTGPAAAEAFTYPAFGNPTYVYTFTGGTSNYVTNPLGISPSSGQTYLVLYGTGIRHHSPNPVEASIGGIKVPVAYAGAAGSANIGLDQINLGPLPLSLAGTGKGDVNISIYVDGVPTNTVTVNFQ